MKQTIFIFVLLIVQPGLATEKIIFAGGCFWGVEEFFRKVPGVVETGVGYSGGKTKSPSYAEVSSGKTQVLGKIH